MATRNKYKAALMVVMLLGLSSCAILDEKPADQNIKPLDWQTRQQLLSSLDDWQVLGRVAMQTDDDAWSASIDWSQEQERYFIQLSGPFNSQAMTITGGPGYAVMVTSDGEKFIETDVNRLLEQHTGWQMPVDGLKYWALGLVDPDQPAQRVFDEQGRLNRLSQSGWTIQYKSYSMQGKVEMPRKIHLENSHFKVKLVFMNWKFDLRES